MCEFECHSAGVYVCLCSYVCVRVLVCAYVCVRVLCAFVCVGGVHGIYNHYMDHQ